MKNKVLLVCIFLLALINIILFWPAALYFLNDDLLHIPLTDNGHFFQTNSVRPIHELLVRLDLFLWGKKAYGYHITALFLHFIVCIQLFFLCLQMQKKLLQIEPEQAIQSALLAVVLFLAYPQSSESLAWIIGRTPVLSAVFFMVTLQLFFAVNNNLFVYLAGAFCFAIALFTYEQCVLLPIALFWLAFIYTEKNKKKEKCIYAAVLLFVDVIYIVVRKLMTSEVIGAYEGGNLLSKNWKMLAENTFRLFFRLILNPADKLVFIISAVCFILISSFIIFSLKKVLLNKRLFVFFTGIIILLIAPVISLGTAVNSFESGRYLYIPSIFFLIAISVAGATVYYQSEKLRNALILFLIFLCSYWLWGKYEASNKYREASSYAMTIENQVQQHFRNRSDTLYIDTLRTTVHRLPVFRLGFKTGMAWLNNPVDTNKIVVKFYYDEFKQTEFKQLK